MEALKTGEKLGETTFGSHPDVSSHRDLNSGRGVPRQQAVVSLPHMNLPTEVIKFYPIT